VAMVINLVHKRYILLIVESKEYNYSISKNNFLHIIL
jgi:hypothetical protein